MTATGKDVNMSRVMRKPVFGGFRPGPTPTGLTTTEDGYRLEISNLGSGRIVLSM